MKKGISRRGFIGHMLGGAAAFTGLSVPLLKIDNAESQQSGRTKMFVVFQLLGGIDPMLFFPYTSIYSELGEFRGDYARLNPSGLTEITPGLGVNQRFSLLSAHFSNMAVIKNAGNAFDSGENRSHATATRRMSLGGSESRYGNQGWTARLYNQGTRLIGFGGYEALFNCNCKNPPLVLNNFDTFDISTTTFSEEQGGLDTARQVKDTLAKLSNLEPNRPVSEIERKYRDSQKSMFSYLDQVSATNAFRTPLHDLYELNYFDPEGAAGSGVFKTYLKLSYKLRNIAQIMLENKTRGKGEALVTTLSLGGFDTHADWRSRGDILIFPFAAALNIFFADLKAMSLFDDVVLACFSEFGRTIFGNGSGTDHGVGYPLMVFGGRVKGQVYGEVETLAGLKLMAETNRNAWRREVASERIVLEILENHLGVDGKSVFPEPHYSKIPKYSDLALFRA